MGNEATEKKIESETIPLTKRTLHWKAFFLGVLAVLLIEVLAVNLITSTNDSITPTLTPSKIPPSPTNIPPIPSNWKTYTDKEDGFALSYPADTYSIDARPQMSIGTLHITVVKDADQTNTIGPDFQPSDYANLKYALLSGSQFSSLQPGQKDKFKTVTISKRNFVRVYPVSTPGCSCDEIAYVSRLDDAFLVISMASDAAAQNTKIDKEQLILQEFGDLQKVLATLTLTK